MKLLLDTHIVLWYTSGSERLPDRARKWIDDADGAYYSIISLLEVAIKHGISSERMPTSDEELAAYADEAGMEFLPLTKQHVSILKTLRLAPEAKKHLDPFDRMLICQAKAENMMLLTHDALLQGYEEPCVLFV